MVKRSTGEDGKQFAGVIWNARLNLSITKKPGSWSPVSSLLM
jgi:hypothetical protein